jgi:hypothetical protein
MRRCLSTGAAVTLEHGARHRWLNQLVPEHSTNKLQPLQVS